MANYSQLVREQRDNIQILINLNNVRELSRKKMSFRTLFRVF